MISFSLDGDPIAKKRPRFDSRKGFPKAYDVQTKLKAQTQWQLRSQFRGEPLTTPLAIDLIFFLPIPKATSNLKKRQMENGLISPCKKPDIDNLVKFIFDAMNSIVFKDDSQVIELRCKKMYSSKPGTTIRLIPLASDKREILYENCARDFR